MSWRLVRDRNQEHLQGRVSGCWRISPDPVGALVRKLGEEYGEFAENRDPGELCDLEDVISELFALLDPEGIAVSRHWEKRKRMGTFRKHVEWHPNPELDL